jgi:hypothetical protein
MIEIVVPDALTGHALLDDDRLSLVREMVGRCVFELDGPLDAGLHIAEQLSEDSPSPVLVNDVTGESGDNRIVDVYMHQGGRRRSVSEGVERPLPE